MARIVSPLRSRVGRGVHVLAVVAVVAAAGADEIVVSGAAVSTVQV